MIKNLSEFKKIFIDENLEILRPQGSQFSNEFVKWFRSYLGIQYDEDLSLKATLIQIDRAMWNIPHPSGNSNRNY